MTLLQRLRARASHAWEIATEHLPTVARGYGNILAVWPDEVFEESLCVYEYPRRRIFVVSDPVDIEYVMVTRVENFEKSGVSRRMLEPLIGGSMFITHGEHWRRQRRIATPAFHTRHVRRFAADMVEQTREMLARWARDGGDAGDAGGEAEIEVGHEMTVLTANIICRTLFSHDLDDRAARLLDAFTRYQDSLGRLAVAELLGLPAWLPRPQGRKGRLAVAELDAMVSEIVARRRAVGVGEGDLLASLLTAVDPETGTSLSDRLVRDELLFLFLAGHETTANAMVWTWYLLSQWPQAEARLHAELDEVLGGREPVYEDVARLPWLRAVLQESMRLYPPVHVYSREPREDDRIRGEPCPAGSNVVIAPWVVHRHRRLWDEPEAFRPERFLAENAAGRSRYAYIPFSAGPRTCLGMNFAMTEMTLTAAMVAQRYRLRLRPGHPVEPLGRLTLRPRYGLPMTLEAR